MPNVYSRGGSAGDANTGGGYGTLRGPELGADSEAERIWPYKERTHLEDEADSSPDREEKSRKAMGKKNKRHFASDHLGQLNYHSNSFVNGQTRGLTGIMSGMDPQAVLEQFIREAAGLDVKAQRRSTYRGMGNKKPIGTGGLAPRAMGSDPTTRIGNYMTLGSKEGWFSPPPPKESDPSMEEPAMSLRDIALNQADRALDNARIEQSRIRKKNRVRETNDRSLRSYVKPMGRHGDHDVLMGHE